MSVHKCESKSCENDGKMRCPTCIKHSIDGGWFCNQDCFKLSWKIHKSVHKIAAPYVPWPNFDFTGEIRPFPVTPMRQIPDTIARPDYANNQDGYPYSEQQVKGSTSIRVLKHDEQEKLRVACKLGRKVLDLAAAVIGVGVTGEEIDRVVHEACIDNECYPSPLNYYTFPKSCCVSVNEVICHGIPDQRPLKNGDIVNVDVTTFHDGYHGDLNETFFVGDKVSQKHKDLVQCSYDCLKKSIDLVHPGIRYREIGNTIQKHASSCGFSVVKTYCGHGIHELFHCTPNVPHYSKNKAVGIMQPGHTFTIEPMISEGTWRDKTWPDNWTSVTMDGKRSAQFEHTLLVTETGCEILTQNTDGLPHFLC